VPHATFPERFGIPQHAVDSRDLLGGWTSPGGPYVH